MLGTLRSYVKETKARLIGNPDKLTLESRIFHSFSLFLFILFLLETIFNLALGLYVSAGITLFIFLIQFVLYYLSRFKDKLGLAVLLSVIEVNVSNSLAYFYNGGIAGSTILFFVSSLFVILSVSKRKHWGIWAAINILAMLGITLYEYFYPGSVKQHYASRGEMFVDIVAAYLIVIVTIYIGTATIRNSYTRQKQLADEKTLALELLNAEKVKLFSIIAHDLRSPLASVQQYFTVMTEVDLDTEERAELERSLVSTINNTQELLKNLLKWAKNQMDGAIAHLQPVNLHRFLEDTAILFKSITRRKEISLNINVDDFITIMADPDMLQIVIRNLLNNAVKFTHVNGHIELTADIKDGNCIIAITDNGTGIPKEKQAELFSLHTTSTEGTRSEQGTGLGLVLCKDYTELQGGTIWFTSVEKGGTTFFISMPIYQTKTSG
jgi:two-component system sensor histidine kinase/response regulator